MTNHDAEPDPAAAPSRLVRLAMGLVVAGVTLFLGLATLEIGLRVFFDDRFGVPDATVKKTNEAHFWQQDRELGWAPRPNGSGTFTNGRFAGKVHYDEHGVRRNSPKGTRKPACRTIFFIGDSATASLEVDDHETVAARFEAMARKKGHCINAVNLGVRGYGTDQAVSRALRAAKRMAPEEIVYTFVSNDTYNNNSVRRSNRIFGKPVWVAKGATEVFAPYNLPVRDFEDGEYEVVLLNDACEPVHHRKVIAAGPTKKAPPPTVSQRFRMWLHDTFSVYRALRIWRNSLRTAATAAGDPYSDLQAGKPWNERFQFAWEDTGVLRARCAGYFDKQIAFHLRRLRAIPSLKKVHVLRFPTVALPGPKSPTRRLFRDLEKRGEIAQFVDGNEELAARQVHPRSLQCPLDGHYCEEGCDLLAQILVKRLGL